MSQFVAGSEAEAIVQFRKGGILLDPGSVIFKVEAPGGAVTTYTHGVDGAVTKLGTGKYKLNVDVPTAGEWIIHAEGTDPADVVIETSFVVQPARVP